MKLWPRLGRRPSPPEGGASIFWGALALDGTSVVSVAVEAGELVLDLYGGDGDWRGFGPDDDLVEVGQVTGSSVLTFRASLEDVIDLAAWERLTEWRDSGQPLSLDVEVDGTGPLGDPRRIALDDGCRRVVLLAR